MKCVRLPALAFVPLLLGSVAPCAAEDLRSGQS
jgi:hypothetical protein